MLKTLTKYISNLPGWRTKKKIVVFESDDWGSIRMPSNEAREKLLKAGVIKNIGAANRYNRFDTLASSEDLEALFEVLTKVKDYKGNNAKFTALSLVANPDFEKIKNSKFSEYHVEGLKKTLERYSVSSALKSWKEGEESGLFYPEFHGREHLNIGAWMRALQKRDVKTLAAFNQGLWGFNRDEKEVNFQAAFDLEIQSDLEIQKKIISEGLQMFEQLHQRKARFFVPPNGKFNNTLEYELHQNGIEFISTPKIQQEVFGKGKEKKNFRYIGKRNKFKQIYITRNSFFEPSGAKSSQVQSCLNEVELAFKFNKPAIISSHRVNFIGGLDEKNRKDSLDELNQLLSKILKKWPQVEFMTSVELGDLIKHDIK